MTPVTLVLPYYNNWNMLGEHFKIVDALPGKLRDLISIVVVDDCSPGTPAVHCIEKRKPQVQLQIFRMRKDVRWNQDACRNLGVAHAETNWVMLTDIDHLVPPATWNVIALRDHDPKHVYKFARVSAPDMSPYKPHPNSWLMTRKMYDNIGGYDERFAGLYGTDGDFRDRVVETCAGIVMLKEPLVRVPRWHIADASTTTYQRKQPEDRVGLARVRAEIDALRESEGGYLPLRFTFEFDRVYPR